MGKKCDLCDGVARMYCESDEASLCWDCDAQVHGANFLVAKHTRCLLCTTCQSATPWKAAGLRLGPTFSVCDSCVALKYTAGDGGGVWNRIVSDSRSQEINGAEHEEDRHDDGDSAESYDDDEDEDEDEEYSDEEDVDEEEAENQVVPWSEAAAAQLPPMMSSSSSDGGGGDLVAKRTRDCSDDEIGCSSAQESSYSPPLKRPSRAAVNSLIRLEGEGTFNDGAVDSSTSSSSSLIFAAMSKTRIDLNR